MAASSPIWMLADGQRIPAALTFDLSAPYCPADVVQISATVSTIIDDARAPRNQLGYPGILYSPIRLCDSPESTMKHQLKWKQCTVSDLGEQDQLDQRQTWYEYESGSAEDEESVQPIKYRGLG
jgi:hypothetical protein